jgi:fructosamine-3-kinase
MNVPAAIEAALAAANLGSSVRSQTDLSGGCIHRVVRLELDDETTVVAKINRAAMLKVFEEEFHGLEALAQTKTVVTPQPLVAMAHDGAAVLLMTALHASDSTNRGWQQCGRDVAAMHAVPTGNRYGWNEDNHLGSSLQPNEWHDNWVDFNACNRLGFQLAMAVDNGLFDRAKAARIECVISRLDRLIPARPQPSLLHGDLWSGNALPTTFVQDGTKKETCAVIDPACSVGDARADIAMMQLFGGFPAEFFKAYEEASGTRLGDEAATTALRVYQLYHVLNHVNLFGRGYVEQAMSLALHLGCDRTAGTVGK